MNRAHCSILIVCLCLLTIDTAYSAGIIYRIQQMKKMRQQPSQEDYERYLQEKQLEQGQQNQDQAPKPQEQPTYDQSVDERNQTIAQAILAAHSPAVSNASIGISSSQKSSSMAQFQSGQANAPSTKASVPMSGNDVRDVVDLAEVWKKLDKKSTVWELLIDEQSKVLTVTEYLDRYRQQGVRITGTPLHYVHMIDQVFSQNTELLQRPFGEIIQMVTIIEYDFDNGMNKDDLARKLLGEAGYEANKKRFQ